MPEPFVPLAEHLHPVAVTPQVQEHAPNAEPARDADCAHDVRRFYACVADAVEAARADLLRDIAAAVLARELQLAPVELESIAASLLTRFAAEEPLRVLAHPDDVHRLRGLDVPASAGERLRRGDVMLVLRYGSIDASLGARLCDVLAARAA